MAIKKDTDPNTRIKIYCLIDPRDNLVRYIGWTHRDLNDRLREHIYKSKGNRNKNNCHRYNWIRKLLSEDVFPIIDSIEETIYSKKEEREKYWIKYYGRENLVNGTDGGEGTLGWSPSQEQRDDASRKLKGKPAWNKGIPMREESRIKLSISHMGQPAWNKGLKMAEDFCKKISDAMSGKPSKLKGIPLSEEHKDKLRQKRTPEQIQNISKALKGRKPQNKGKILNVERSSSYIGCYWHNQSERWHSRIVVDGKRIHLSQFEVEIHSAFAYDIGEIFFYNDLYDLNFPELRENYISYLEQYDIQDIKQLRQVIKNYINEEGSE